MSAPTMTKTYDYEVVNAEGKRVKGRIDGSTAASVAQALKETGVVPVSVKEAGVGLNREIKLPGLGNRLKLDDLANFTRQFGTMIQSGLTLLHALSILETQTSKPVLKKAIGDMVRDIEGGSSLSAALTKRDRVFPKLMVAMVAAGETGGFLDEALDQVATNMEREAWLRGKIKAALTYPVIVMCFSILMIIGVLLFIVPVFERMFSQLGGRLPLPTQIMVDISHAMWWILPILIALTVGGVILFRRKLREDPAWRLWFDRLRLRMPVFGDLFLKIAVIRFARTLGTLLQVGVPVMQALDMVGDASGNAVIGEAVKQIKKAVRDGQPMSGPIVENPLFPPMVAQMIKVGEETGQITPMLNKVGDYYQRQVETTTESLTAAIEPIMVVGMGAMIGVMVVCLYLPMFTIYQNINGQ